MNRTPKHFPKMTFASLTAAMHPLVQFLTNNHPSFDGPGWTIIEAFSDGVRAVPGDPGDLDSFPGGFGWRNDVSSLVVGDWIVLRSIRGGNEFQLYLELESSTTFAYIMFPYDDFVTGGAAVTPPVFPDRSLGSGASFGTLNEQTGYDAPAKYTVIADPGCAIFFFDAGGTSCSWGYVGDVENAEENPRPFCLYDNTSSVDINTATSWCFLDPHEEEQHQGSWMYLTNWQATSTILDNDSAGDDLLGYRRVNPVGLMAFGATGGFFGYPRYVYVGHVGLGVDGTIDGRSYVFKNTATNRGAIVMAWDRLTEYP